jgi:hypothetical protein
MSVSVINLRQNRPCDFKCDRSTPLGNPFWMVDEEDRDIVCDNYDKLFWENLNPDVAPKGEST